MPVSPRRGKKRHPPNLVLRLLFRPFLLALIDKGPAIQQNRASLENTRICRRAKLANSAQARKRARQAEKNRQLNASQRSAFRTSLKKVVNAIEAGDKEAAAAAYVAAVPMIDSTSNKGLIHKNKAARHKSRLNAQIKAMCLLLYNRIMIKSVNDRLFFGSRPPPPCQLHL